MSYTSQVPDTLARPDEWLPLIGCRTENINLFFDSHRRHEARTVCVTRCPVRAQCRNYILRAERGLGLSTRVGIVAGLEAKERFQLDATMAKDDEDEPVLEVKPPECGTWRAYHRHLQLGEAVDSLCWSAEVRRQASRINYEQLATAVATR